MTTTEQVQAVGRRKRSVARVTMRPGSGQVRVNGRPAEEYFPLLRHRSAIEQPLAAVEAEGIYDIIVRVRGGGIGEIASIDSVIWVMSATPYTRRSSEDSRYSAFVSAHS